MPVVSRLWPKLREAALFVRKCCLKQEKKSLQTPGWYDGRQQKNTSRQTTPFTDPPPPPHSGSRVWATCKDLLNLNQSWVDLLGYVQQQRRCSVAEVVHRSLKCFLLSLYSHTHQYHITPPLTGRGAVRLKEGHMLSYQGNEFSLVAKQSSPHWAGQLWGQQSIMLNLKYSSAKHDAHSKRQKRCLLEISTGYCDSWESVTPMTVIT